MGTAPDARAHSVSPWFLAWLMVAPLALVLLVSKTGKVFLAFFYLGNTLDSSSPLAVLRWLWGFTSLRFALALLAAIVVQRWVFPRRRILIVPMAAAFMVALALASVLFKGSQTLIQTLSNWTIMAVEQGWMVMACIWNDAILVAMLVLVVGAFLQVRPAMAPGWRVRIVQTIVVLLCALVGIDYVYQLAMGQPTNTRVLVFAATNIKDMAPLVNAEVTPFRVIAVLAPILGSAVWAWYTRRLALLTVRRGWHPDASFCVSGMMAAAVFFPGLDVGFLEAERHTEGTIAALVKSMKPSPAEEIRARAQEDYVQSGQATWNSSNMQLTPTSVARKRNVVIVMMESVRAVSTTIHSPGIATTPFLKQLADKGMQVEDMNAVIPRTAAAWMAVLTGQYPVTNEGIAKWAEERTNGAPVIRGLPTALRELGYGTSYFSPTVREIFNDTELLQALGFDSIVTGKDLMRPGMKNANYFGLADDAMVDPIMEWTRAQMKAGRPFMTTIMTNVGHHDYTTPDSWEKVRFEGVNDPVLTSYYNCLLYIDGVIARLMQGYEELGVLDETVFVFLGDHGQIFGEHGLKQSFNAIYQEGIHVPAVIYAPGLITPNQRISGSRQQIDVLPTVVELLGYRIENARLPGKSLLSPADPNRRLYLSSSVDWTFLGVRQGRRKFIYSFDRNPMEVYDLETDPTETHALQNVDPRELASIRNDLLEWKVNAELAMYGVPGHAKSEHVRAGGP
ncbi:sulfatase-like hydrolase/transferase [Variovorax ginsengisoli]|uniref:Sulfatase-like hydrolase/transferase n=1 Tax=Variovorax ginsengisoli TaxID=363844 RepID=A0ABT8S4B6_9BURK|nr:sulfatase-like hydrolase/transferase [Variovorax ginsengisoli]MDN8614571.1 sulfatase-like hydrolase/transferase [Variovorax ginsengisoli]MDO1533741.1 sulfatase-like hydrolase/transferase [Variovorax ginsengisoli]